MNSRNGLGTLLRLGVIACCVTAAALFSTRAIAGGVWLADNTNIGSSMMVRVSGNGKISKTFALGGGNYSPNIFAVGTHNDLWVGYDEGASDQLLHVSQSGRLLKVSTLKFDSAMTSIALDSDGNVWIAGDRYVESFMGAGVDIVGTNYVAAYNEQDGLIRSITLAHSKPCQLLRANDQSMWIATDHGVYLTSLHGQPRKILSTSGACPYLGLSPSGKLWVAAVAAAPARLGQWKLNLTEYRNSGQRIRHFTHPFTGDNSISGLVATNDAIWVATYAHLLKLDLNGRLLGTRQLPDEPAGLAIDDKGDVWIAGNTGNYARPSWLIRLSAAGHAIFFNTLPGVFVTGIHSD